VSLHARRLPVHDALIGVELLLAAAIAGGSCCWLGTLLAAFLFRRPSSPIAAKFESWPPVTILKPVCGLEKNLRQNLRTACEQDYPEYQVVYSVQRHDDPAIELLRDLEREFGSDRVVVVIDDMQVGMNGKINNLAGALGHARYDILVISDSDVRLRPDYLKAIVAPLADPTIGGVSTFYRAVDASAWYEQMELLALNVDQCAMAMFASLIGVSDFCFGASFALRRETLERIGGFAALSSYLVEDNEMGQRILRAGLKLAMVPYLIDTTIDLKSPAQWWQKMTYWEQNMRAAKPGVFLSSLVLRTVPLALLLAAVRGWDGIGLAVLLGALAVRATAAAVTLSVALQDRRSLRSLWLLPIKDVLSLFWYTRAIVTRTVNWRGVELALTRDGQLIPNEPHR
jgi:ceramide glucosyltransferase